MGPTIKLGYMEHLRQCLIFGMRKVILIAIPAYLIVYYLSTEVVNTSIIQSITSSSPIDSSNDYTITIIGARYSQNYCMYTVCNINN